MNTQRNFDYFLAFVALGSALCLAITLAVIVQVSDATKARKASEHTQLVCFNDDRISTDNHFTECRRITWRPA